MVRKIKNRAGQAAVWIIFGIVLIVVMILIISLLREVNIITPPIGDAPFEIQSFLQGCSTDSVLEAVDIMLPQGGFIAPQNTVRFNGSDVEYICETIQYYEPCIQQHPMLINEMEMEIKSYIAGDLENCFDEMKDDFKARGWEMNFVSLLDFNVDLNLGKVVLDITRPTIIESEEDRRTFDNFYIEIPSPAHDLARVALDIAAQEGDPDLCYFEHRGYSLTYPRFKIDLYNQMPDSTKIYTINDVYSGKFMRIAVRSCAIPQGL